MRVEIDGVDYETVKRFLFDAEYHATVYLVGRLLLWAVRPLRYMP